MTARTPEFVRVCARLGSATPKDLHERGALTTANLTLWHERRAATSLAVRHDRCETYLSDMKASEALYCGQ